MKSITFNATTDGYVAEIKITDVAAINITREKPGPLYIELKHFENGGWSNVFSVDNNISKDSDVDMTISDDVYPVYIRIVSSSAVTSASGTDSITQVTV